MRKKSVDSSFANSTVSASVESSRDFSSSMHFFGTRVFNSPETPSNFSPLRSQCASRCPSVATIVIDSGLSTISAPFSVYRDSSLAMAKPVFAIIERNTAAGILITPAAGNTGSAGKFDFAMPTIFVFERPQRMLTQWFSSNLMVISASGSNFT